LGPVVVERWRRPGWMLLVVLFVVLPLAAVWLVDPILFSVYGNGHVISPDSPGADLAAAAGAVTVPWWVVSLLTYVWVTGASLD